MVIGKGFEKRGWAKLGSAEDEVTFLDFARKLGTILPNRRGESIGEIVVTSSENARNGTFSSRFGKGSFPLHTDVAFWDKPARLIVMRVLGDARRPTTVFSTEALLHLGGNNLHNDIHNSIWTLRGQSSTVYCKMTLRSHHSQLGIRYDSGCMQAANDSAKRVADAIERVSENHLDEISWTNGMVAVISNMFALHGRGKEPEQERQRTIQRIYVE